MTEQEEFEFRRRREREKATKPKPGAVAAGERRARDTLGITPETIAADEKHDLGEGNILELEKEIARTPPGKERDILVEEHNRIKATAPKVTAAKAPGMYVPSGERPVSFADPELLAAHPLTQFATGAASLPMGAVQMAEKTGPGQLASHLVERFSGALGLPYTKGGMVEPITELTEAGRKRLGDEGIPWWNIAGSVLGPAAATGKIVTGAPTIGQRLLQGGLAGGLAAGGQPVTGPEEEFLPKKAAQVGTGAFLGSAIPAIGTALGGLKTRAGHMLDLVMPKGGEEIAKRYAQRIVGGPEQRAAVVPALEAARNIVPSSKPTVAEAVADVPEGSPLLALQKIIAGTPGGVSSEFGKRVLEQEGARRKVLQDLSTRGTPEQQIVARALQKKLTTMIETQPGKVPVTGQENPTAFLNALIKDDQFVKSVTGIPKPISQVFNKTQLKKIEAVAEELKTKLQIARPPQKTNLRGGVNIAEETRTHFPQALSRPMMIANAVLKTLGAGVEPRVDKAMQEMFLNPNVMARALEDVPPDQRAQVIRALINSGTLAGGAAAAAGREEGQY